MSLSREQLIGFCFVKTHEISIDGIPDKLLVKEMSGAEREDYFLRIAGADKIKVSNGKGEMVDVPNPRGLEAFIISVSLVDESFKPLFSESEVGKMFKGEISTRLFDKLAELNGLLNKSVADAKKN